MEMERARLLVRQRRPAAWCLALALGLALAGPGDLANMRRAEGSTSGGFPPGWSQVGPRGRKPSRIILVYNSGGMPAWTADRLLYYVCHVRPDGTPDDWFFDTVLVLALAADSQRGFEPNYGNGPSLAEDWQWYLDQRLFGGASELAALEEAVATAGRQLRDQSHVVRVIIGVPYPDPRAGNFGNLDGRALDFTRCEDRAAAVRWYLRQVSRRWTASHFEHLRLAGFYWVREEVPESDRGLLRLASELVGGQLLPFLWIPYYGSVGGNEWRQLGFDVAIQQPNYFFCETAPDRIQQAARFARQHFMGFEMELDRRVVHSEECRGRYRRYLEGGVDYGYQHANMLAWYDDGALLACGQAQDPELRYLYDDTYQFAKGTYCRRERAEFNPGSDRPSDEQASASSVPPE